MAKKKKPTKVKTHKGASKRFKVTKNGKVLHRSHYLRHSSDRLTGLLDHQTFRRD
jgi:ribosomal protein L35